MTVQAKRELGKADATPTGEATQKYMTVFDKRKTVMRKTVGKGLVGYA